MVSWAMEFENKKELRDHLTKVYSLLSVEEDSHIWTRFSKDRVLVICSRKYDYTWFAGFLSFVSLACFIWAGLITGCITGFFALLTWFVHTGYFNYTIFRWSVERGGYKGKSWFRGQASGFLRLLNWDKN